MPVKAGIKCLRVIIYLTKSVLFILFITGLNVYFYGIVHARMSVVRFDWSQGKICLYIYTYVYIFFFI